MTATGRGRYAIIPTHNRHNELSRLVAEMCTQVDVVLVVDNASDPPVSLDDLLAARFARRASDDADGTIWLWRDEEQPPHLYRMWNAGLRAAAVRALGLGQIEWDVALLNDDAVVPPGWMALVAGAMRAGPATAACCVSSVSRPILKVDPDRDPARRLYGPAFVIRGELATKPGDPLWVDERLRWWFGDTDMDWRARRAGGMLIVPGPHVPNTHANETTIGELGEQAGRDRETFADIWGWAPW